jgi:hypothetical protein
MLSFLRRRPFTILGVITLGLFLLVEYADVEILARVMRVLIVPMYAAWVLAHYIRQVIPLQGAIWMGTLFVIGMSPYLLADYILSVARRRGAKVDLKARKVVAQPGDGGR